MENPTSVNPTEDAETSFLSPPEIIRNPGAEYSGAKRQFQGIPSIAHIPGGRLWATWYGGKTPGEDHNNYVMLATSGDGGKTWSDLILVLDPDGEGPVRAFDPEIWLDPDGRLWLFWAQGLGHNKKGTVSGVWAMTANAPDRTDTQWSSPRRLCDGVMMCKPLVLSTGPWCLPVSKWHQVEHSAQLVVSCDRGKTWETRGTCDVPEKVRSHDEHTVVEKRDRSLWMLVRTNYGIGESVSADGGQTWGALTPSPLKHPSSRFFLRRLRSGRLLLVRHDPADGNFADGVSRGTRSHLKAFLSEDDGRTWPHSLLIDARTSVSYPDGDQAEDGTMYIIYDFQRREAREILMVVFCEEDVIAGKAVTPQARLGVVVNKAGDPA